MHPYEDEQFLSEHPEIRERLAKTAATDAPPATTGDAPPPYTPRRHSYSGRSSSPAKDTDKKKRYDEHSADEADDNGAGPSTSSAAAGSSKQQRRGFFGKIKDKAIGTKEEREEARRQEAIVCLSPLMLHFSANSDHGTFM